MDEDKVENQKELNYLDWLNRVETLMSDEETIWCIVQKIWFI